MDLDSQSGSLFADRGPGSFTWTSVAIYQSERLPLTLWWYQALQNSSAVAGLPATLHRSPHLRGRIRWPARVTCPALLYLERVPVCGWLGWGGREGGGSLDRQGRAATNQLCTCVEQQCRHENDRPVSLCGNSSVGEVVRSTAPVVLKFWGPV